MLRAELDDEVGSLELQVALAVNPGGTLALAGPSGAGKSTILRLLSGIRTPRRGRITNAEELWLDTERGVARPPEERRCGYVFQDYALFPHLSAWRNVAYGLRGASRSERQSRAVAMLERFGIAERADARPRELSGGERQRLALARALASDPAVLLLDEPLAALDPRTRGEAARVLSAALAELEAPAILVTHDWEQAAQLSDDVAVVQDGRIVQQDTPTALAGNPASAFVADFTGAVVLSGTVIGRGGELTAVALDGGGVVSATGPAAGRVAVTLYPWEITIARRSSEGSDSAQNHICARIDSLTTVGNRVRLSLAAGQPLVAELSAKASRELGLAVGTEVVASWKATATRLTAL